MDKQTTLSNSNLQTPSAVVKTAVSAVEDSCVRAIEHCLVSLSHYLISKTGIFPIDWIFCEGVFRWLHFSSEIVMNCDQIITIINCLLVELKKCDRKDQTGAKNLLRPRNKSQKYIFIWSCMSHWSTVGIAAQMRSNGNKLMTLELENLFLIRLVLLS